MRVFYLNRKYIYIALILLIVIYILLFYIISLQMTINKYKGNNVYEEENNIYELTIYWYTFKRQ